MDVLICTAILKKINNRDKITHKENLESIVLKRNQPVIKEYDNNLYNSRYNNRDFEKCLILCFNRFKILIKRCIILKQ